MAQDNANMAALIGSRICHDLISPIGAIHNGLELLDMSGVASGPEMGLIADSVTDAEARIRFFRLAYGAAGDQQVPSSEVTAALKGATCGDRISVTWRPIVAQTRADVQLALLAVQCLETAMPYGGETVISEDGGRWTVAGLAARLSIDPVLWTSLSVPSADAHITPALVQFALLPVTAQANGKKIQVETDPNGVKIRF